MKLGPLELVLILAVIVFAIWGFVWFIKTLFKSGKEFRNGLKSESKSSRTKVSPRGKVISEYCGHCGQKIKSSLRYCTKCGEPVEVT